VGAAALGCGVLFACSSFESEDTDGADAGGSGVPSVDAAGAGGDPEGRAPGVNAGSSDGSHVLTWTCGAPEKVRRTQSQCSNERAKCQGVGLPTGQLCNVAGRQFNHACTSCEQVGEGDNYEYMRTVCRCT
jgi:hypothetical protein